MAVLLQAIRDAHACYHHMSLGRVNSHQIGKPWEVIRNDILRFRDSAYLVLICYNADFCPSKFRKMIDLALVGNVDQVALKYAPKHVD